MRHVTVVSQNIRLEKVFWGAFDGLPEGRQFIAVLIYIGIDAGSHYIHVYFLAGLLPLQR
jgi:hypothetical protein